jgi:hypothetical protein
LRGRKSQRDEAESQQDEQKGFHCNLRDAARMVTDLKTVTIVTYRRLGESLTYELQPMNCEGLSCCM